MSAAKPLGPRLMSAMRRSLNSDYRGELLRKLGTKMAAPALTADARVSAEWCAAQETDADAWAAALDGEAWREAEAFAAEQDQRGRALAHALALGGGGFTKLLYFVTRLRRPACVVETGVAAGHSSRAFLKAMHANGGGRLYSSDLPYLAVEGSEKNIGVIVESALRTDWRLYTRGDRRNLNEIAAELRDGPKIDLFHYDSDKTYEGRAYAWTKLAPLLAPGALVIFDDIQDNTHFRDLVAELKAPFRVFRSSGKWIGMFELGGGRFAA